MRVLVTGAGGQLGLDTIDAFAAVEGNEVVGLTRADLDVSVEHDVLAAVRDHEPHVVVHTAAWTDVDGCEDDPGRAHRVNALGPWWVARACDLVDATMVHVSTDYVFSGQRGTGPGVSQERDRTSPTASGPGDDPRKPWTEFDQVEPLNVYGESKAAGEELVRRTLRRHHIVRTAWVNGARGNNFVTTMLRLGRERGAVAVVTDQVGSPTFTRDLADALRELASNDRYGTWHRTNSGSCSWYDLAEATFAVAGVEVDLSATTADAFPRPAARPAWSVLSDVHANGAGLRILPHWRDGLTRMLDELEADA